MIVLECAYYIELNLILVRGYGTRINESLVIYLEFRLSLTFAAFCITATSANNGQISILTPSGIPFLNLVFSFWLKIYMFTSSWVLISLSMLGIIFLHFSTLALFCLSLSFETYSYLWCWVLHLLFISLLLESIYITTLHNKNINPSETETDLVLNASRCCNLDVWSSQSISLPAPINPHRIADNQRNHVLVAGAFLACFWWSVWRTSEICYCWHCYHLVARVVVLYLCFHLFTARGSLRNDCSPWCRFFASFLSWVQPHAFWITFGRCLEPVFLRILWAFLRGHI